MNVRECLAAAAARLGGEEGRLEAEVLLLHVVQRPRVWLYAHADDALPAAALLKFDELIQRRAQGEPVAYIVGRREFWSLDLLVNPATLIPRADTERLVELALQRLAPGQHVDVADLGTGSGAVALAIAHERTQARVVATDASAAALAVARENAQENSIVNVEFVQGYWFAPLDGRRFGLIVSNPPYIAADDRHLQQGDLRFEPAAALAAGRDGLDDIRQIVAQAGGHLLPGAWLLLEHGYDQAEAVRALLQHAGFVEIDSWRDLAGQERVSGGCWPGPETAEM